MIKIDNKQIIMEYSGKRNQVLLCHKEKHNTAFTFTAFFLQTSFKGVEYQQRYRQHCKPDK